MTAKKNWSDTDIRWCDVYRGDKPQGRWRELYDNPEHYQVLRYMGRSDPFILWVDEMPHDKFRHLFVRPFSRQYEPKVAYKAVIEKRHGHKVLCIYLKEWGHITDNTWQLIAYDVPTKDMLDDWGLLHKRARLILRGYYPTDVMKVKS